MSQLLAYSQIATCHCEFFSTTTVKIYTSTNPVIAFESTPVPQIKEKRNNERYCKVCEYMIVHQKLHIEQRMTSTL